MTVLKLLADVLLDPITTLPIEAESLKNKMAALSSSRDSKQGPATFPRLLMALSMKGTVVPLLIKLSLPSHMLLDVCQYEIGGVLRTYVKDIDRGALAQAAGVEDVGLLVIMRRKSNAAEPLGMPPMHLGSSSARRAGHLKGGALEGLEDLIASAAPRIRLDQ
jgi:hypothetical protein